MPIHFHINGTNLIRLVKHDQLIFLSSEINKPLPALFQYLVDPIKVQKPIQVVAADQIPDRT